MVAPEIFDSALQWIQDLREGCRAQAAQLETRVARLTEAEELFAQRLNVARQRHERNADQIRKDREALAEFRAKVMAEAIQSQDLCEQAAIREEEVRQREVELDRRTTKLCDRKERAALRELEAASREEVLDHREAKVAEAKGALAVRKHAAEVLMEKHVEERVQAALLDFRSQLETQEQRGREWLRRAEEAVGKPIEELEAKFQIIDGAVESSSFTPKH